MEIIDNRDVTLGSAREDSDLKHDIDCFRAYGPHVSRKKEPQGRHGGPGAPFFH